jgi:hypothetical protein
LASRLYVPERGGRAPLPPQAEQRTPDTGRPHRLHAVSVIGSFKTAEADKRSAMPLRFMVLSLASVCYLGLFSVFGYLVETLIA